MTNANHCIRHGRPRGQITAAFWHGPQLNQTQQPATVPRGAVSSTAIEFCWFSVNKKMGRNGLITAGPQIEA